MSILPEVEVRTEGCEVNWICTRTEDSLYFQVFDEDGFYELCTVRAFEDELFLEVETDEATVVHLVGMLKDEFCATIVASMIWELS